MAQCYAYRLNPHYLKAFIHFWREGKNGEVRREERRVVWMAVMAVWYRTYLAWCPHCLWAEHSDPWYHDGSPYSCEGGLHFQGNTKSKWYVSFRSTTSRTISQGVSIPPSRTLSWWTWPGQLLNQLHSTPSPTKFTKKNISETMICFITDGYWPDWPPSQNFVRQQVYNNSDGLLFKLARGWAFEGQDIIRCSHFPLQDDLQVQW